MYAVIKFKDEITDDLDNEYYRYYEEEEEEENEFNYNPWMAQDYLSVLKK